METEFLRDGTIVSMSSDPANGDARSFQRLYEHSVPKRKRGALKEQLQGWRLSATIRLRDKGHYDFNAGVGDCTYKRLEDGVELRKWNSGVILDATELRALRDELLDQLHAHGTADRTFFMGTWHDNGGRTILELADTAGQSYTYGGKTTPAGQAFGPVLRRLLTEKLGPRIFGAELPIAVFWAHLVYYPTPDGCGLAWHSDSEAGIDPHCIASITFLEDPENGARPFQVRRRRLLKTSAK